MPGPTDLPDVNVWLALGVPDHPHHERARHYWFEEAQESQGFCRITALGFLRLCTNATVMGGEPLSVPMAWKAFDAFRQLPEVQMIAEPEGCDSILQGWAEDGFSPRLWTDAYLASFAISGGFRLVTFDRDFTTFEGLDHLLLEVA